MREICAKVDFEYPISLTELYSLPFLYIPNLWTFSNLLVLFTYYITAFFNCLGMHTAAWLHETFLTLLMGPLQWSAGSLPDSVNWFSTWLSELVLNLTMWTGSLPDSVSWFSTWLCVMVLYLTLCNGSLPDSVNWFSTWLCELVLYLTLWTGYLPNSVYWFSTWLD